MGIVMSVMGNGLKYEPEVGQWVCKIPNGRFILNLSSVRIAVLPYLGYTQ